MINCSTKVFAVYTQFHEKIGKILSTSETLAPGARVPLDISNSLFEHVIVWLVDGLCTSCVANDWVSLFTSAYERSRTTGIFPVGRSGYAKLKCSNIGTRFGFA
jgi:hypothetical protein